MSARLERRSLPEPLQLRAYESEALCPRAGGSLKLASREEGLDDKIPTNIIISRAFSVDFSQSFEARSRGASLGMLSKRLKMASARRRERNYCLANYAGRHIQHRCVQRTVLAVRTPNPRLLTSDSEPRSGSRSFVEMIKDKKQTQKASQMRLRFKLTLAR